MHILGSMISIGANDVKVPVPWWHRAPLGLESGTHVYVCVTAPREDRPGDLLVSVLDPNCWDQHLSLGCRLPEEPGVVEKVLTHIKKWNIALAETVTVNGGQQHQVDLIIEAIQLGDDINAPDVKQIKKAMTEADIEVEIRPRFEPLDTRIEFTEQCRVEHGWIVPPLDGRDASSRNWREIMRRQLHGLGANRFDERKLVLSCDTSGRLLRGVIPRRGSLIAEIVHADQQGVLRHLTAALRKEGVNLLSGLLKRGGASVGTAVLVAVCEPTQVVKSDEEFAERVRSAVASVDQKLQPKLKRLSRGLDPSSVVYCNHPEDIVVHVPEQIRARVVSRRQELDPLRPAVFLSRRFLKGDRPREYAAKVRRSLERLNCQVVEAKVQPGNRTTVDEVSSAMWTASAGLVLAIKSEQESELAFSLSVAHEFGFLQGQGKPLILLVESNSKVKAELNDFSNIKGIQAAIFDPNASDDSEDSIDSLVGNWIRQVFPKYPKPTHGPDEFDLSSPLGHA